MLHFFCPAPLTLLYNLSPWPPPLRLFGRLGVQVPETKGLSLEQIEALFLRRGQRDTRGS